MVSPAYGPWSLKNPWATVQDPCNPWTTVEKPLITVEKTLKTEVTVPERLKDTFVKEKKSTPIKDYNQLRSYLLD